jgi:hypothetical protein
MIKGVDISAYLLMLCSMSSQASHACQLLIAAADYFFFEGSG